jgi:hypothetical protein
MRLPHWTNSLYRFPVITSFMVQGWPLAIKSAFQAPCRVFSAAKSGTVSRKRTINMKRVLVIAELLFCVPPGEIVAEEVIATADPWRRCQQHGNACVYPKQETGSPQIKAKK